VSYSAMGLADSTEIRQELVVSGMAPEYEAGQLMKISLDLAIRDICLFNPVLRLFIRRAGMEEHLLGTDTHQGAQFYPWQPLGDYRFNFGWPVT